MTSRREKFEKERELVIQSTLHQLGPQSDVIDLVYKSGGRDKLIDALISLRSGAQMAQVLLATIGDKDFGAQLIRRIGLEEESAMIMQECLADVVGTVLHSVNQDIERAVALVQNEDIKDEEKN